MSKHFCDVLAFIYSWTMWTVSAHDTLKEMLQFVVNSIKVVYSFFLWHYFACVLAQKNQIRKDKQLIIMWTDLHVVENIWVNG